MVLCRVVPAHRMTTWFWKKKISRLRAFREHLKSADDIERAEAYQTGLRMTIRSSEK